MRPASGGLNIFKSIFEVRFHYPLPLNPVRELQILKRRKLNSICHSLRRKSPLKHLTEGKMEGWGRRGRSRKHLLDYFKAKIMYCNLREEVPDRTIWRTWLGKGNEPVLRRTMQCRNRLYHESKQTLVRHGSGTSAVTRSEDCFLDGTTSFVKNSFCARALLSHHTPLPSTA
jgi:hypothetical protein